MNIRMISAVFLTAILTFSMSRSLESSAAPPTQNSFPALTNTCLITNDVKRLTSFYAQALEMEPHKIDDSYVEFRMGTTVLAIFSGEAQEKYIPGSAKAGQNHSVILEFKVSDVDREYARLQGFVKTWVKKPSTQPWGTRSIYFRDPDGNLVDFFTPADSR
jgi:catechol 2,3-dioxygenase-like lactoylglutathione lyase family enzyme